jgi:hypothetical protein
MKIITTLMVVLALSSVVCSQDYSMSSEMLQQIRHIVSMMKTTSTTTTTLPDEGGGTTCHNLKDCHIGGGGGTGGILIRDPEPFRFMGLNRFAQMYR